MSRNLLRLLAFLQTFCLWHLIWGKNVYLFGVTPNEDLMAITIDSTAEGKSKPIGLPLRLHLLRHVKMISYDSTSQSILVESQDGGVEQSALCHNQLASHRPMLNTSKLVYLEEDSGSVCWNCRVTNYALYNSHVYFVLNGVFEDRTGVKAKKVQLRVMQSCSACNLTQSISDYAIFEMFRAPFLFNCSKRIAEVYNSRTSGDENIKIKSGHSLKIVKHQDGYLSFFFQIFYGKYSQSDHFVDLDLYHVTEKGTVELLHTEKIHRRFANWKINGVAGVDYNAGVLCWTVGDRIYCGDFMDQELSKTTMVLYPGDSVTKDVCKGSRPNLLPIVTGISIIDVTYTHRTLVFGCYIQWPLLGGAGLLVTNTQMTNTQIFPVYLGDQRLMLGSLFTTMEVSSECQSIGNVAMCENPSNFPRDGSVQEVNTMKETLKEKNRTKTNKPQSTNQRDVPYRVHAMPNDTEIIPIKYDLDSHTIILSEQDRKLLNTNGIANSGEKVIASIWFYAGLLLLPTYSGVLFGQG